MDHDLKSIADDARKLSPDKQAELIEMLIDGLSRTDSDWAAAWSTEAERRWTLLTAGGMQTYPAEQVLADIATHLEKRRRRT